METGRSEVAAVMLHDLEDYLNGCGSRGAHRLEQVSAPVVIPNPDGSTGAKYTPHFAQSSTRITQMLEHVMREGGIERIVGKGKFVYIRALERNVARAVLVRESASTF